MNETLLYNIKQGLRRFSYRFRGLPGLYGATASTFRNAKGHCILVYHGVCPSHPYKYNSLFISVSQFRKQLELFRKYCHVISLADYHAGRFRSGRFNIALSFDDGFANNHRYAWPLLEAFRMPATFFVTAVRDAGYPFLWNDFIAVNSRYGPQEITVEGDIFRKKWGRTYVSTRTGRMLGDVLRDEGSDTKEQLMRNWPGKNYLQNRFDSDYWMQLTKEEIASISRSSWITIGSHGYFHNDLGRIPPALIRQEIAASKTFLENITGRHITQLAFPYGSYRAETITIARDCGFTELYATDFNYPEDCLHTDMRERLGINPYASANYQLLTAIRKQYD